MALFREIQEYIALDANNITLVFDSGNIVNISGNIFLYPPQGHPILYKCLCHQASIWNVLLSVTFTLIKLVLQPAILSLSKHVIRFHELPAGQCNIPYDRLFKVDWSLSGIMTSNLVIREFVSAQPAASSILISRMTSSSVIIPYRDFVCFIYFQ